MATNGRTTPPQTALANSLCPTKRVQSLVVHDFICSYVIFFITYSYLEKCYPDDGNSIMERYFLRGMRDLCLPTPLFNCRICNCGLSVCTHTLCTTLYTDCPMGTIISSMSTKTAFPHFRPIFNGILTTISNFGPFCAENIVRNY